MGSKIRIKINSVIPIATSYRHSAQNIAFHEIGRQSIMADPEWRKEIIMQRKTFSKERTCCCQNDSTYNIFI